MQNASWGPLGRAFAWVHAGGYAIASIIFVLVAFRVTTPAPPAAVDGVTAESATALIAFERAIWPQVLALNLIFFVAFFALVPIASTLRELLGGDPRAQLAAATIQTGAILGIVATLQGLSATSALVRVTDRAAGLPAVVAEDVAANGLWLLVAFLFLVGTGILYAGRLALRRGVLPRGWAQLSIVVGAVYWIGTAVNVLASVTDPATAQILDRVWQLTVLAGGVVLAPAWAIWLARSLEPVARVAPAPLGA
jgi:hypothetical protein